MLTWQEIWLYIRLVLRWWWVLILAMAIAGSTAFFLAIQQPQLYSTRVSIMVGDSFSALSPDEFSFGVSNTLARFYGELARRELILQPVTEQLQLPFPWHILNTNMIYTNVNSQANLLEIWVTDTNPERAAAIANTIAAELIRFSPNSPEKIAEQRTVLAEQIKVTKASFDSVEQRIKELKDRQAQLVSAVDLRTVESQISELEKVRDRYQTTYNQQLTLLNSSMVNSLSIFEPANVPVLPLPSKKPLIIALAAAGGLLLAIIAILLLDRIDERWRTSRDLRERYGLATLGTVTGITPIRGTANREQAAQREHAMREAHTHILLAAMEYGTRTIMVSSPEPSEIRSAFVVDLADLFTRSGYRVLLIDSDTETHHLAELIGQAETSSNQIVLRDGDAKLWPYLQQTTIENVMLLERQIGPNGNSVVPSLPWPNLVRALERTADVIIFNGPSALSSADAALLAPLVDGVVLTLDPTRDLRAAINESYARLLRQRGVNMLGAVVLQESSNTNSSNHKRRMVTGRASTPGQQGVNSGNTNDKHDVVGSTSPSAVDLDSEEAMGTAYAQEETETTDTPTSANDLTTTAPTQRKRRKTIMTPAQKRERRMNRA
ncbi:MAG: CpsD/CapB family tyrosine-protein kinase [Chloroflexales bacterium]|nr:CpsD/CapB family tyrosine-protein kinase [Chloroflexales bacterium]